MPHAYNVDMNQLDARFEERLRQLRATFIGSLPGRIERLRGALERLPSDPSARATVREIAHQLSGTGTSYGYPQLSTWGREVEAMCKAESDVAALSAATDSLTVIVENIRSTAPAPTVPPAPSAPSAA